MNCDTWQYTGYLVYHFFRVGGTVTLVIVVEVIFNLHVCIFDVGFV